MNRNSLTDLVPDAGGGGMPDDAVALGPGEGRRFRTGLSHGTVKVESGSADFSVFESSPPPGAPGAPPHVHHSYDEAWFIIEGTVEFVLGDRRERLEAGGFAFAPRGVVHSFANPGPAEARMLVIGSGPAAAMVEEVGRLSDAGPLSPDTLMEVFRRHDSALA
jgi:mannose-6-phosphate isomerase-like protein (cupin superfamily)